MIKIEAVDLESAILDASKKLNCKYSDVDYYILQEPLIGIFGVGKKSALILASIKINVPNLVHVHSANDLSNIDSENVNNENIIQKISKKIGYTNDSENSEKILQEIKEHIFRLMDLTCFEIDTIAVSILNEETLFVLFDGKDAPLLIGREGYRYKSIVFALQSWISAKYDLKLQLEIGEFIKKQNENIDRYLKDEVFQAVSEKGSFETKILDDTLVKLAIKKLRDRYKDKYVKVRNTQDGSKFIVIDDFFTKKA